MSGIIDIVVNLYTPQEVELGQTGLDDDFKKQVRMPEDMRGGVTTSTSKTSRLLARAKPLATARGGPTLR